MQITPKENLHNKIKIKTQVSIQKVSEWTHDEQKIPETEILKLLS